MIFSVAFMVFIFSMAFVSAQSVIITTDAETNIWKADGTTVYRLDVSLDNTQASRGTDSVGYRLMLPSFVSVVDYTEIPVQGEYPENDFFEGVDMFIETVDLEGSSSFLVGRNAWFEVNNRSGRTASFWFTVNPDAPKEEFTFEFDFVDITSSLGLQSKTIQHESITIEGPKITAGGCGGRVKCSKIADLPLNDEFDIFPKFSFVYSLFF